MLRRRGLQLRRHPMGSPFVVIVPMRVNRPTTVPMRVTMARQYGSAATRRCVERIILRVGFIVVAVIVPVVVAAVAMGVFGETGAIGLRVAAVVERHRHIKPMRLGNLAHGLPERAALDEQEHLPSVGFAKRLHLHPLGVRRAIAGSGAGLRSHKSTAR